MAVIPTAPRSSPAPRAQPTSIGLQTSPQHRLTRPTAHLTSNAAVAAESATGVLDLVEKQHDRLPDLGDHNLGLAALDARDAQQDRHGRLGRSRAALMRASTCAIASSR
jgi:hypothetical protein